MTPKVFIHIGINKTGTSSIQHHFKINRDTFASANIYYPKIGLDDAAHHSLLNWARYPQKFESDIHRLVETSRTYETTIISSEALVDLESPETLIDFFDGFDVRVIVYLRDPVRHAISWWQQDIQMGRSFVDMQSYLCQKRMSFLGLLDRWERAAGAGNLDVRLYDRSALPDGNVLKDFLEATGVKDTSGQSWLPWENNPSISGNLLFLKLIYNSLSLPHACSQAMVAGLTDATKLRSEFRSTPYVSASLANHTHSLFRNELDTIRTRYELTVPISQSVKGVPVPDLDSLGADIETLSSRFSERTLPLLEMLRYLDFRHKV